MCTKPLTPWARLSPKRVTSPPRKKLKTTFKSQVVDSKEDEERTCLDKMGGGDGKKLQAIATQGNLEEESEPNLDQVIDNIQVEPIEHVVPITKFKQPIVVVIKSSQPIQLVVEPGHIENP
jgi:hypothetical protein